MNNNRLRNLLMPAVFSDQCNHMAAAELPQCNVCSARFSVYPFHSATGNFFVAQCSYIQKILPPHRYQQAKESLLEQLGLLNRNQTEFDLAPPREFAFPPSLINEAKSVIESTPLNQRWKIERPSWIGISRFAMEHWVHSHPTVQACDVHPFWDGNYRIRKTNILHYSPALQLVPNNMTASYNEYFPPWLQLPGRLIEWELLYGPNAKPPNTSWAWNFYTSLDKSTR
jgi:hypothetical protein